MVVEMMISHLPKRTDVSVSVNVLHEERLNPVLKHQEKGNDAIHGTQS
jgi:hypothetical protein